MPRPALLSPDDRVKLTVAVRRPSLSDAVRQAARILLALDSGMRVAVVARTLIVSEVTVRKAMRRLASLGVDGLVAAEIKGGRPRISSVKRQRVLELGAAIDLGIREIANQAGVSIGTASKLLGRRKKGVRKKTRPSAAVTPPGTAPAIEP